jgi:hypothetical protein
LTDPLPLLYNTLAGFKKNIGDGVNILLKFGTVNPNNLLGQQVQIEEFELNWVIAIPLCA